MINLAAREAGVITVPGHRTFSWPSWAGPGTLVAALAAGREGDSIALLDVQKPAEAKIIEVLWRRGDDLDVAPRWPVYRADARRCIFVGEEPLKRTLLSVRRGEPGRVERLEPRGYNYKFGGLAFSPDCRYLLLCADRPERPKLRREGASEPPTTRRRSARPGVPLAVLGCPSRPIRLRRRRKR